MANTSNNTKNRKLGSNLFRYGSIGHISSSFHMFDVLPSSPLRGWASGPQRPSLGFGCRVQLLSAFDRFSYPLHPDMRSAKLLGVELPINGDSRACSACCLLYTAHTAYRAPHRLVLRTCPTTSCGSRHADTMSTGESIPMVPSMWCTTTEAAVID